MSPLWRHKETDKKTGWIYLGIERWNILNRLTRCNYQVWACLLCGDRTVNLIPSYVATKEANIETQLVSCDSCVDIKSLFIRHYSAIGQNDGQNIFYNSLIFYNSWLFELPVYKTALNQKLMKARSARWARCLNRFSDFLLDFYNNKKFSQKCYSDSTAPNPKVPLF